MNRMAILITVSAIVGAVLVLNADRGADMTLTNARAVPLEGQHNRFMVTFEIQNHGPAKTLTGVDSVSATTVHVMNPGHGDVPVVIPAYSNGLFAMDGAHVMVMGANDDFVEGSSLPLTLTFDDGAEVTARVLHTGAGAGMSHGMSHDMSNGIQLDQPPLIELAAPNGFTAEGADVAVAVNDFTFVRVADGTPHVANEGHGHIYLNGLKLGRLYDTDFSIGGLSSGAYELTVILNAHSHQPYLNGENVVQDTLTFNID